MVYLKYVSKNLEEILAGSLLLVMVTIAFVNVVSRFTFQFSIAFIEELEIYLYVWLVLLGSSSAFKRWKHLSVTILVDRFPQKMQKGINILISVFTISFFAILFYYSLQQVRMERLMGVTSTSMDVPMWFYTVGVPIGCVLIIIRVIQRIIFLAKEGGSQA